MTWDKVLRAVGTYAVVGAFAFGIGLDYLDYLWNYLW